ncbi:diaminohydroxyphosphoribosylaminopyrimidine deaminase [Bacillus sp. OV322]|uniref:bifunctional diaminohydroxyphosphoribosylaminopyrimidine deaminase/5-amino-6-(5-phosphoribosylamino)uracil reductase RibD n=1 Tax=Bacillus sp. OV322 TaxID=1882764 RepID=UPI0008ED4B8C|nr:bifunctional diaminohydroxyphosphoribosylaminopyrimidine deaminase/5-amino-6-(5-phosphoribosylamino)uracil reductase RibD [Bacillus sp. OV322]SFC86776.1 diaminohydroxyphosphoribosylaminopyrimidine deaminase [Bacillus sp. OV322]
MNDQEYMKIALGLAAAAAGQTSPNPAVGAVIVKDGEIAGMGAHLKAGEDHAEIHALKMAGDKARDATMYVTLEPCSHFGKTPPCAAALIKAGIKRVYISSADPNPLVAGKGIKMLEEAGIEVHSGLLSEKGDELNEVFFHFIRTGTPFVTMKQAVTLDGKTAAESGDSKWITCEESRLDVHRERSRHDAILVGVNTVLKDNPRLTNRINREARQPVRIILDTHLRTPKDCAAIKDETAETLIITGSEAEQKNIDRIESDKVKVLRMPSDSIKIMDVLKLLAKRGITSLYVEGGSEVNASFLKEHAVGRMITYIAPKLAGRKAHGMFGDLNVKMMPDAYSLEFEKVERIGKDLKITSRLKQVEKCSQES